LQEPVVVERVATQALVALVEDKATYLVLPETVVAVAEAELVEVAVAGKEPVEVAQVFMVLDLLELEEPVEIHTVTKVLVVAVVQEELLDRVLQ
jgi:hypothetical protein